MCEYLRPVVALEWLKASCCTDMITCMSSFSWLGRNTEHADSKELPVMAMYKIWNCQTLHKSVEITNALIAVHVTSHDTITCTRRLLMQSMSHFFLARRMYVCTLRMLHAWTRCSYFNRSIFIDAWLYTMQSPLSTSAHIAGELVVFFSYELSLT